MPKSVATVFTWQVKGEYVGGRALNSLDLQCLCFLVTSVVCGI
jgi:hypothetical protein